MKSRVLLFIALFVSSCAAQVQFPYTKAPPVEEGAPAGWSEFELDGTTNPLNSTVVEYDSGSTTFTVGVNGGRIFSTEDSFAGWQFASATTGDITLTARIKTATQVGGISSKSGIMLREDLILGSQHCLLNVFALNGTLIDCRATLDGATTSDYFDGTLVTITECLKIEVDRDITSVKYFQKDDATDCSTGSYTELLQQFPAWAGATQVIYMMLATTPSDTLNEGKNATTTFDQVTISTASIDHAPGDIDFNPTSYEVSEEVTPLTITVTRTGEGTGTCSIDYSLTDGSALAGTDYTDTSGTLSWAALETGNKTFNVIIIDRDAVTQGNKQFTADLVKNVCANDNLNTLSATVTILDQDVAGASWTAHSPTNTIVKGMSGFGVDWSTFLATDPTYEFFFITNLNTSGAGSFDACISGSQASNVLRICIPEVSGLIEYPQNSFKGVDTDNLVVAFQYAPDPGLHVKGVNINIKGGVRQFWSHYSFFGDNDLVTQGTGKGLDFIGDGRSPKTLDKIVVLNFGGNFAFDGALTARHGIDGFTVTQSMSVNPIIDAKFAQGWLLGHRNFSSNNFTFTRNVTAHTQQRGPAWFSMTGILSNNLCYNCKDQHMLFGEMDTGIDINIEDNLFIAGPQTDTAGLVLRYGTFIGTIVNPIDIWQDGNRVFGFDYTETPPSNMVLDRSEGNVTLVGAELTNALPQGYVSTDIGGDAGEQDFAALVCAHAGPRPAARLAIYQAICDNIENKFLATTPLGLIITTVGQHAQGFPTIAENTCDSSIANDCGTGVPAIPTADPKGADTFINKTWTALQDAHCARMSAGATGC